MLTAALLLLCFVYLQCSTTPDSATMKAVTAQDGGCSISLAQIAWALLFDIMVKVPAACHIGSVGTDALYLILSLDIKPASLALYHDVIEVKVSTKLASLLQDVHRHILHLLAVQKADLGQNEEY